MRVICTLRGDQEAHDSLKRGAHESALSINSFILARLGLMPGVCRVCGCTEKSGCPEGCSWANDEQTLCSVCDQFLAGDGIHGSGSSRDQWPDAGHDFSGWANRNVKEGSMSRRKFREPKIVHRPKGLVLERMPMESIEIDGPSRVHVVSTGPRSTRLAIEAEPTVRIRRSELPERPRAA